ncbi:O-antigen translocase [Pseudofulvibacter geojedonensis]|uniref:O-antigen translocase n=1 Tax=Pseudofulvibacter geojedonensis TaxID=1123758 RepID=A0ABW3I5K0_9FLAO
MLKITSFNSMGVSIRLVLAFVSQKVIAELLGPSGVAQLGNIRNILPMIESFSTLGVFNGIVKYVSEHREEEKELQKLFSTAFVYILCASLFAFFVLFFGAEILNDYIFPNQEFSFVFKIVAISVPFIALVRIFNGVVNGLSAYKSFVTINLISYVCSILLLIVMVLYKNINGALIAIAISPIVQFTLVAYFYIKVIKDYVKFKDLSFSIPYKNELFAFTIMSLVSTFLGNFVEMYLRGELTNKIGIHDAGNWTGMTNISKQYIMFISAILTLYVLPKFSTIKNSIAFRKEVLNIYKTVLPLFALGMLLIFFCREWVILIAKSDEFLGMKPLFKWQLLGDFIKIASVIIAHQFFAKKMVIQFVVTELFSLIIFYFLASFFIESLGAEGVVLAHFIRFVLYFLLVVVMLKKHLFGNHAIKG